MPEIIKVHAYCPQCATALRSIRDEVYATHVARRYFHERASWAKSPKYPCRAWMTRGEAEAQRTELEGGVCLFPKSPLRGFSDVAAVFVFLILVVIVALAYLLSKWVAAHFDGPRLVDVAVSLLPGRMR